MFFVWQYGQEGLGSPSFVILLRCFAIRCNLGEGDRYCTMVFASEMRDEIKRRFFNECSDAFVNSFMALLIRFNLDSKVSSCFFFFFRLSNSACNFDLFF